jgi:hypothetical protein
MLDIAMQACQASSEGFRMWKIRRSCSTSKLRQAEISQASRFEADGASEHGTRQLCVTWVDIVLRARPTRAVDEARSRIE